SVVSGKLDHTGYALFDVATTSAPRLTLTGTLPAGTAGAVMLVARKGTTVRKTTEGVVPTGGKATVALDDPGSYDRITAVVVNGSSTHAGWGGTDWKWTRDQQPVTLAASTGTAGGGTQTPPPGDGGGTQAPGGGAGGGGATPGGGGSKDTLLSLTLGKAPRLSKAKALTMTV